MCEGHAGRDVVGCPSSKNEDRLTFLAGGASAACSALVSSADGVEMNVILNAACRDSKDMRDCVNT